MNFDGFHRLVLPLNHKIALTLEVGRTFCSSHESHCCPFRSQAFNRFKVVDNVAAEINCTDVV